MNEILYYKTVKDGIITSINSGSVVPILENKLEPEDYDALMEVIKNKPVDTLESVYRLSNETGMYEPFERTEEEKIQWYIQVVSAGTVALEDVPEEYRTEVEAQAQAQEDSNEQEVFDGIMQEVSEYGY